MANRSKNPSGGAGLLFLTGLGLEVLVVVVAGRATLTDALADSPLLSMPNPFDSTGSTMTEPAPPPGVQSTIESEVDGALAGSTEICWGLAEPSDHGVELTVAATARGGRIDAAVVTGVSGPLAACIEAEALEWSVTPTIQQISVVRARALPQ